MNTKLGQYHVAEPLSAMRTLHFHSGATLKEVDHEPKLAVLDQEDLIKQGIDTSAIVPGAKKVDALGSCVFNAETAHLSNVLGETRFGTFIGSATDPYTDTKNAEIAAIKLYHDTTDLTGNPSSEWPPTDCGSSGVLVMKELVSKGIISDYKSATGANNVISLLQAQSVIVGQPWFNSWFEPGGSAIVDGDGSESALSAAMKSGVAGGHETHISAIEKLTVSALGNVVPEKTILRVRNSWSSSWGDHGSYRIHLSTYMYLHAYVDFRQAVA